MMKFVRGQANNTVLCLCIQIPSRLNLRRMWTAVESLRPDKVQHGDRPPSGSPAKQTQVSPSFFFFPFWPHLFCSVMLKSDLFSVSDNFADRPPPLPAQKPVGDLKRQNSTPVPAPQVRFFFLITQSHHLHTPI